MEINKIKRLVLIIKNNQNFQLFEFHLGVLVKFDYEEESGVLSVGDICIGEIKKIGTHYSFLTCLEKDVFINNTEIERDRLPVKIGQKLIVQIEKEDILEKKAKATTRCFLKGHFCSVYRQKPQIKNEDKYKDLQTKIEPIKLLVHESEKAVNEKKLAQEAVSLSILLKNILRQIESNNTSLFKNGIIERTVASLSTNTTIITSSKEIIKRAKEIATVLDKKLSFKHTSSQQIVKLFKPSALLEELLSLNLPLRNGGNLIIQFTDSLTTIDVNSGKVSTNNFSSVNREAIKEILRQIKLKNISGIIVVDFINNNSSKDEFKKEVKEACKKDFLITKADFIKDSLILAIIRKQEGKEAAKSLMHRCGLCLGMGLLSNEQLVLEQLAYKLMELINLGNKKLVLQFKNAEIMQNFLNKKQDLLLLCAENQINLEFRVPCEVNDFIVPV